MLALMEFIAWREEFSVGIHRIDEEHKKLIGLINRLLEGMRANRHGEVLGPIFGELVDYARIHFANEEALLLKHGYPAAAEHAAEHRRFVGELSALMADKLSSPSLVSHEAMEFLRDWLGAHILEADKAYAPFLKSKGVE
jgi:hemerythrin